MTMRSHKATAGVVIVAVTLLTSPTPVERSDGTALAQQNSEIIGQDGTPMVLVTAGKFTFGDSSYNHPERRIYLDSF